MTRLRARRIREEDLPADAWSTSPLSETSSGPTSTTSAFCASGSVSGLDTSILRIKSSAGSVAGAGSGSIAASVVSVSRIPSSSIPCSSSVPPGRISSVSTSSASACSSSYASVCISVSCTDPSYTAAAAVCPKSSAARKIAMPVFFIPFSYLFCVFPAAVTVTVTRFFCDPDRIRIVAFPFLRAVTTPKADTVTTLQSEERYFSFS